jgi:hypothetical protein
MVESSTLEVNMADIRWSSSQVHQPEVLEHLWQFSYYKLLHTVETLASEDIITDATADSLQQVAYDFKVCLEALEELHDVLVERDTKKKDTELED